MMMPLTYVYESSQVAFPAGNNQGGGNQGGGGGPGFLSWMSQGGGGPGGGQEGGQWPARPPPGQNQDKGFLKYD